MRHGRGFWAAVLVLAAVAAYLRLTAIDWGAPYVYHPDEHFVLHRALDIVRTGDPNPRWFQYPSLLIYVEALVIAVLQPVVGAPLESNYLINGIGPWDVLPSQWPFVVGGRVAVGLSGVAGVVLLAIAGARLFGAPVGVAAAALLLAAPMHNNSAHYLLADVPATTFLIASLCASVARRPRWLLAGLLAGLAAGTKYTAGLALLAPAVLAVEVRRPAESSARLGRLLLGAVLGFLLSTPFALLDLPAFWDGLVTQRQNYLRGFDLGGNWRWYLEYLYRSGIGPLTAVLAMLGCVRAAGNVMAGARGGGEGRRNLALLLPVLLYFPWLSSYPSRAERNLMVLVPFLVLLAAEILRRFALIFRPRWLARAVFAVLAAVAVASSVDLVAAQNRRLGFPDTRTLSRRWIEENFPPGTKLAREEYTPQVAPSQYDVTYVWSLAWRPYGWYVSNRIRYLIASSNVYGRALGPQHVGGESAREFYRLLFTLPLVREFRPAADTKGPIIRIYEVPLTSALPPAGAG